MALETNQSKNDAASFCNSILKEIWKKINTK